MELSSRRDLRQPDSWAGMIPPVVLPITEQGDIDFNSLDRLVKFLVANGSSALWVNGSSGDFTVLSPEEREQVVATAVAAAGTVPVIAQVGDASTRMTLRHAEAAVRAGASAVSVVTPYYAIYAEAELESHFRAVGAATGLPVFIYHLPSFTKVTLPIGLVTRLARDSAIVGFKESQADADYFRRLIGALAVAEAPVATYTGSAVLADVYLMMGATGILCGPSNFMPAPINRLYRAFRAGDMQEVRRIQQLIIAAMAPVSLPGRTTWSPSLAAYRYLLWELGVIDSPTATAPTIPLSADERRMLKERAVPAIVRAVDAVAAAG